ncbi:hypothetical protein MAP00_001239 [Monascus purpureus]|nr:hypothetical protein MAP00_001239 [Monascus purpureus]
MYQANHSADGRHAARRHGKSSATISTLRLVVSDLDSDLASLFFSSRQRLFPSSNSPAVARCQRDLPGTGDNHPKPLLVPLFLPFIEHLLHIILHLALVTDRFFPELVRARELCAPSVLPSVDDCLARSIPTRGNRIVIFCSTCVFF